MTKLGGQVVSVLAIVAVLALGYLAPGYAVAAELPNGRVYEQVSPVDKNGGQAGLGTPGLSASGEDEGEVLYAYATPEGGALMYGASGPFGAATSGVDVLSVAQRSGGGWSTTAALPHGSGATLGNVLEEGASGILPSLDATRLMFTSPGSFVAADPNLGESSAGEAAGVWLNGLGGSTEWLSQPSPSVVPNPVPGHLGASGNAMVLAGGSPKLDTAYFAYFGTLVPQDAARSVHVLVNGTGPWGFYEWKEGTLAAAGVLPDGSLDPYGALPAGGFGHHEIFSSPDDVNNQVSADGKRAFFVSPDPGSTLTPEEEGIVDPPELYVREDGQRTVLVSRDALAGGEPAPGPRGDSVVGVENSDACSVYQLCPAYVYASPDGSRAFFESDDKLADSSSGREPTGVGPWAYEFDVDTESLTYLPGVTDEAGGTSPVLASSADGSSFIFEKKNSAGAVTELGLFSPRGVTKISALPAPPSTFLPGGEADNKGTLYLAAARATADGSVFAFETDSPLPGFNDAPGYSEVFRYDAKSATLDCVSCPPVGTVPSGDARLSNDAHLPLGVPEDFRGEMQALRGSRGMSADGSEVFFDTPERLVEGDINGQRDVYEWENGHLYLISSGTSPQPSVFLDNSESGEDVFFATTQGLVASDVDGSYDVYDARVGGGFPEAHPPAPCMSDCRAPGVPPTFFTPTSATFSGEGNLATAPAPPSSQRKAAKPRKREPRKSRPKRKKQAHKAAHRRAASAGARRR